MKKIFSYILFFIFVFFMAASINAEEIKNFHSDLIINKDGTVNVKETIVYDFADLQKHGIYREIPFIKNNQDGKKYQLEFKNFNVQDEDGNNYSFTTSNIDEKIIRLKIGDADKLITGIHNYIISYNVAGALTYFSDHDELYWNVTGNEWTVPIASTTASVVWPQEVNINVVKGKCYTGNIGSTLSDCVSSVDNGSTVFNVNNQLETGQGLTIVVSFPKNIVAVLEPKEFVPFSQTLLGKLVTALMVLVGLIWYVGLPFFIVFKWLRSGRDSSTRSARSGQVPGIVSAWFDPPKSQDGKRFLTPGEVGTLGDETVDMKDISATIVDLARRGYLIIDERKKGDFYLVLRSLDEGGSNKKDQLLTYEKTILSKFFGDDNEIRIKDKELATEVLQIKNEMYEQVIKDKLFDKNPQTTRMIYYVIAGIALFTGNFFLAIVAFVFGRVMPRKTLYGVNAFNVSKSLKNFLTSQERQLKFQADKQMMFEKLLPYAIAFGVERIWAKRFESINLQQPNWYRGYSSANFSSYLLVSSLSSSFRSINTAATPTRSSSGFSSGFGGGGFSGGGGGGGGGGSW